MNSVELVRFEAKFVPEPNTGCWLWFGALRGGYGSMGQQRGRVRSAHRLAYEHWIGPIPAGLCLDHLCRTRNCVNPEHLEPVTNEENIKRGDAGKFNRSKTHCHAGHLLAGDNLYVYRNGRTCRQCKRDADRLGARRRRSTPASAWRK